MICCVSHASILIFTYNYILSFRFPVYPAGPGSVDPAGRWELAYNHIVARRANVDKSILILNILCLKILCCNILCLNILYDLILILSLALHFI